MAWVVLLISAGFEAIWATALGYTEGFSRLVPSVIFLVTLAISMVGLGWAAKHIPIGTAYAIWTGLGAGLTVAIAIASGNEIASVWKLVFLTGIIAGAVGLKLTSKKKGPAPATNPAVSPG